MERVTVAEIVNAIGGVLLSGAAGTVVQGVSIDSRTIKPGELYIAIRGKRFDGHQFVVEARRKGAVGVLIEEGTGGEEAGVVVRVPDTRAALLALARWYRTQLATRVVAITGSNGKTTTKEMLATLLAERFKVVKAPASFNNDIGVPLTVLAMDRTTEVGIFEIEMNELGGTRRLAEMCQPQVGVVTNIGDTHLEFMGDRNGVAKEKAELLEALPEGGVAVVNFDDPLVMGLVRATRARVVRFGLGAGAAIFAREVVDEGINGTRFVFMDSFPVHLPLPGRHNVLNFLAAGAAAHMLGLSFAEIAGRAARCCAAPRRLSVRRLNGVVLIDDCFNANPQSMRAALAVLTATAPRQRRVAILGDMLELGAAADTLHRQLGLEAAGCVDRLVVIGDKARLIADGAWTGGMAVNRIRHYPDADSVGDDLFDIFQPGDTILVKGSRALALEKITERIVQYYGEKND